MSFGIPSLQTIFGFHGICMIFRVNPKSFFGSLSSKQLRCHCICMILGVNPESFLGSLASKPLGFHGICVIFKVNPKSFFGFLSSKQLRFHCICMILGVDPEFFLGSLASKPLGFDGIFTVFASTVVIVSHLIPNVNYCNLVTDRNMHCSHENCHYGNVSIAILSPCQVKK